MLILKKCKSINRFCAFTLGLLLATSGTAVIGTKSVVLASDASCELNYYEKSLYPIQTFTMSTASAVGGGSNSYITLEENNTLSITSKSEKAAVFELYNYGDGTSAMKCLNNSKFLSFKNYKPEYENVIMADAKTVGWNERFKINDNGSGAKYITSHFTYNRDEENRDNTKSRKISLAPYKEQNDILSLNVETPEQDKDMFIFTDVKEPAVSPKVYSKVTGNKAELSWDLIKGFNSSKNYAVKLVVDSKEVVADTIINIKGNKAIANIKNLPAGKECTVEVEIIDNNDKVITSKNVPIRIFNHPGLLHSEADLDALRDHVENKMEPWYSDFLALKNTVPSDIASLNFNIVARTGVGRGNPQDSGNIGDFDRGGLAAYYDALQWIATGDDKYADKAVQILNAWASTLKVIDGRDNILGAGIDGYHFVNAAEIIRYYKGGYSGYKAEDFKMFKDMMINVVYPVIQDFGVPMTANGNWDAAAYVTMASIGVLCDNTEIFNRAISYYSSEEGNGSIKNYVTDSGQTQESGRDQAHAQLGIGYMAETCEVAWKQGIDLYSLEDNRLYRAFEYSAKYNLFNDDVPFEPVPNVYGRTDIWSYWSERLDQQTINRGELRPIYELALSHYKGRMGLSAEWIGKAAEAMRPQGYVNTDNLNFGTLTQYNGLTANEVPTSIFKIRTRQGDKYENSWAKLPDGSYSAETKESYLDLQPDNTLAITSKRISAPYFQIFALDDGNYALKCLKNNKYLSFKQDDQYVIKADADVIGENEKFKFFGNGNTCKYLTFPELGNRRVGIVDNYQKYEYATYKGSNDDATTDDKYLTLSLNAEKPAKDTDMFIQIYDNGSFNVR